MKKTEKFRPFLMALLGGILGLLIANTALFYHIHQMPVFNPNGWMTGKGIGSKEADLFTRAVISKIGIFANSKEQAIYLSACIDDSIDYKKLFPFKDWLSLSADKHYRIEGNVKIPVSWWSITLYNNSDFLVENPEDRYSFTSFNLVTDANGNFAIDVASQKPADATNWLPAPHNGSFNLKLRIYEPFAEVYENIATYPLPRVKEVGEI